MLEPTRQFWSSLRYDIREASFWWEGWGGTVNVTELQWAIGQPDLSSKYECVTLTLAGDVAVYEMSSCSNFSTVLCEGDELPQPASEKSSFRSFSKGNRQNGFCEPNQTGTPVCTFYHSLEEEVQLLEMCRVDVEEDCLLMCLGMSQCVHVVHIRSSTHPGTCLIHGKLIP
ncbi:uncharacterized protein LOC124139857 [Haliotis rufescens]|uniref:uncharacterized protein LOC124139857 n=1 Tax=Haliotis rufescens TaxID=6454 RepID=UPI00201F0EE3|nr:uncharacterized protein LOC124139857 [Haliotis rufescens]